MESKNATSRLKGFFRLSPAQRKKKLTEHCHGMDERDFLALEKGLSVEQADLMSENVFATFSLPFGIAANFVVDGKSVLVPMVTEEPSIVAGSSKMAKIVSLSGGFKTQVGDPLLKAQIQFTKFRDIDRALSQFESERDSLFSYLRSLCPSMNARGGGVKDLAARVVVTEDFGPMLAVEFNTDVRDAMGANLVNTLAEKFSLKLKSLFDAEMGLRILSNYCDQRIARARCEIDTRLLAPDSTKDGGFEIAQKIHAANSFAKADIYRACTHNKGILNGMDALALATGNDFRAIEASSHAHACRSGRYRALTDIGVSQSTKKLEAKLEVPLALGVVGGACKFHPGVLFSHKILGDFSKSSTLLASVMVSVGLSQCLAALLALCSEGIQKGHMRLHQKKWESQ